MRIKDKIALVTGGSRGIGRLFVYVWLKKVQELQLSMFWKRRRNRSPQRSKPRVARRWR